MAEKIKVKDITQTRDDKDSPHAQHNLDVHDPNAYFNFLKEKREEINNVARLYKRETSRFEHAAGPRDDKKKGVVVVAVVVVSFSSRARASRRRRRRLAFLRCVLSRLQKGRTIN